MTPLLIALQFLTRLPVRLPGMPEPRLIGRSLLWYPLVGVLIGALLLAGAWLLEGRPVLLSSALLLALWVGLSGGLHLDGLADTADAWVGGYGDRERTLTIMKDPRSGPIAVVVLVVVLLLKFAALAALLQTGQWLPLLLAPWLARGMLPLLFLTTPYVRSGGLGQALAEYLPRRELPLWLGGQAVVMLVLGWGAWIALVAALVLFGWLRGRFMQRLGGTTGDTAGAMVEIVEVGVLVGVVIALA
ncbi:adenosylcobinamide-GDP ribazoletransferase [Metapseudomonas lalkuanensis]|uniref:adenosylcobinamide-GDP ribazoletransferase n=1 Tax=Metapseudomonas lalkuanensis TaxID=2604832 RepID=UPI001CF14275|nr:adenosylcobinamide-GDP ribazoletransferase [Pseudomonas lalkuanensis]UCO96760.1 adenosylcobinamide-GDP ribazoletransferase [Pseudomonas lalkuanensis]